MAEVQAVFCAGAWVGVVILAMAVIDAQLRETEVPGFAGSARDLIRVAGVNEELQSLRKRRNALVHVNPDAPALTVDQQWSERTVLEQDARRAIRLMAEAFFTTPMV
jgi:hypothetical protein